MSDPIEAALAHLVSLGDRGFASFDSSYGHALAERVRLGLGLTVTQRRSASRVLAKYADRLDAAGIHLGEPAVGPPPPPVPQITAPAVEPVSVAVMGEVIALWSPFSLRSIAAGVPGGRWKKTIPPRGAWTFPASATTARNLAESFKDYDLQADPAFLDLVAQAEAATVSAKAKTAEELPAIPGETLTSWLHQRRAFWALKDLTAAGLWADMGCVGGDTMITVNRGGNARRMPIRVLHERLSSGSWSEEIATRIRSLKADGTIGLVDLAASLEKGVQPVVRLTLDDGKALVCTLDHEIVVAGRGKVHAEDLVPGDAVLVDPGVPAKGSALRVKKPRKPYPAHRVRGRSIDGKGYAWLYLPGHPNANANGQVLEHVKVMADLVGRPLAAPEIVHHANGDRLDNRPENLILCADQADHARYHDWTANLPGRTPATALVSSVEAVGEQVVYDLSVLDDAHTYVANGVVVGNTGKSKIATDLLRTNGARAVLIVAPKRAVGVWPKQLDIHAPGLFHAITGQRVKRDGGVALIPIAERTAAFDKALHECRCGRAHVVVANYEATAHDPFRTWALEQRWDYGVLDESHRIKSHGGVWSKWAAKLRTRAARRLCLSGTPMGQSPLDVFAQYRFLDPGIFGVSYTSFERRYAIKGGFEGHEVIGLRFLPRLKNGKPNLDYHPELAREFDAKVFSIAFEVGAEVLDLPEVMHTERIFDLPPQVMKMYEEVDHDMITTWQEQEMSTPNVLVKMLRAQQLTGGYFTSDDGEGIEVDTTKREELEDVLVDIDPAEVVVVFAKFLHDLDSVRIVTEKLGRRYAELSGRRDDGLAQDATLAIDAGVVGVQIQAGGVGVDFTKARFGIYYSVGHSRIDYEQSVRRLHRPGQHRPVLFIRIMARSTIDEDVFHALGSTGDVIETVMKRRLTRRAA